MSFHRQVDGGDICAIFVHAGAGYHSVQNEKIHLRAVNEAAQVGMAVLKNGGDAIDAVEMAVRLLEDREITNAGYGSNLTIEGHVECDATLVDHLGRSGAIGAVSNIQNPIALARVVLEASAKPLTLQRVPPNLLVGPGATEFAKDYGISMVPHGFLISPAAKARWNGWKQDLIDAEANDGKIKAIHNRSPSALPVTLSPPVTPDHSHGNAPYVSEIAPGVFSSHPRATHFTRPAVSGGAHIPRPETMAPEGVISGTFHQYARVSNVMVDGDIPNTTGQDIIDPIPSPAKRQRTDGIDGRSAAADGTLDYNFNTSSGNRLSPSGPNDCINDTVGAIAVDCFGNIAAGSSSGGIGMKHKGRCGPAALVGIGTAVVPVDQDDQNKTCVATVTSGTGEHMATTSAAATAAERIYLSVRRRGTRMEDCTEDEALHSMIKHDFMRHPGVRDQACVGAIGILAVKKTKSGIYFYFGHNTDSFALASMHSEERKPVVTMSRSRGNGSVAQGGRVSRTRRAKT